MSVSADQPTHRVADGFIPWFDTVCRNLVCCHQRLMPLIVVKEMQAQTTCSSHHRFGDSSWKLVFMLISETNWAPISGNWMFLFWTSKSDTVCWIRKSANSRDFLNQASQIRQERTIGSSYFRRTPLCSLDICFNHQRRQSCLYWCFVCVIVFVPCLCQSYRIW